MSQQLKQRVQVDKLLEKSSETLVKPSKATLLSMKPDYVIRVFYKLDPKTNKPTLEAEANLKVLLSILRLNGFNVTIRPDVNDNFLLLFVTLNDSAFEKFLNLSKEIDTLLNVESIVSKEDKISIAERLRLIYLKLTLHKDQGGCGIEVGKGDIKALVPVRHLLNLEKEFKKNMKGFGKVFRKRIRDESTSFLRENLGSTYALYHKFVQNYVSSVGCIAIFGIFAWFYLGNFSLIYASINLLIGFTCYLCVYAGDKKVQKDWKLKNISKTEIIRYKTTEIVPNWKVLLLQLLFLPVTGFSATGLFLIQFSCFVLEIFINEIYQGPFQSILALIPTVLVCVLVPAGTIIYGIIANKYVEIERNPTHEGKARSVLAKMFIFNCLAAYSPLLITSFIYLPIGYCLNRHLASIKTFIGNFATSYHYVPNIPTLDSEYKVNNKRLSSQIFYFMVINQVIVITTEFVIPIIVAKFSTITFIAKILGTPASTKTFTTKEVDNSEDHEFLEIVRAEIFKPQASIDDDYRQMVIQYGFLMLFGPVWTLGALCCFVFGLLEQEGDYMKYIKFAQAPVPSRSESSQPWISFMRYLLVVGSFVSIAITLMYKNAEATEEILSFVGQSSVKSSWFTVFSGALFSTIIVQIALNGFENIIDHFYDSDENVKLTEEIKTGSLITEFAKRETDVANVDVEGLLAEAEIIYSGN